MVNDDEVKLLRQHVNWRVAKLVQRALMPVDADAAMGLFVTLRGGNQRRQRATVIPCNAGKVDGLGHAAGRRMMLLPELAEAHAASIISIEASPRSPGEPFGALPRMASKKFSAGDSPG